ncbi:MAG: uracil-DNA glycosylase [Bacillales bacterium]|jgi:uracil-DNA glycosylase|nr:uracil-DNA glycosylase [Bacillales bacterium]
MNIHNLIREEKKSNKKFRKLLDHIQKEYENKIICPKYSNIFEAFQERDIEDFNVIILGVEPYAVSELADGYAFSVNQGEKPTQVLENIFRELEMDLKIKRNGKTSLKGWADQGVLLLNTILTVEEGKPASHDSFGWQAFTLEIFYRLLESKKPKVFVLWGQKALDYSGLINSYKHNGHRWIGGAYPSNLTANSGFYGSRPFSRVNRFLAENNLSAVDWSK